MCAAARLPSAPPRWLVRVVLTLRRALLGAANALLPPDARLIELATGVAATKLLEMAAVHRIADHLAAGPRSAAELAEVAGVDADALHRALRALCYLGVFRLRGDGRFENNRCSRALAAGALGRARAACAYIGSSSNVRAWNDFGETVRTGANAFERVHARSVWQWFDEHPDERELFAEFMLGRTEADAAGIAARYPFGEVTRVCDVGGGRGMLLSEILLRHPHLHGVLCDAPGVVASARALLEERGVAGRIELHPGSFFESVPPGADAYLLKNILHDWDDARCERILGVVRRAMQSGQRLLVIEWITEREDALGLGALADVQMMTVCCEGRERGRAELGQLLQRAGFRVRRVLPTPTVSIVEALAVN